MRAVPLAVVHQHGSWIDHTETLSTRRSRTRDRKYGETRAASGSSRPASSTQAGVVDTDRDLHPVADLQLVEEPRDVRLDRRDGQIELTSDVGVAQSTPDGHGDLALALGELVETHLGVGGPAVGGLAADLSDQGRRHRG